MGIVEIDEGVIKILEFQKVTLAQKPLFESYISKSHQRGSECAFSNNYVWRDSPVKANQWMEENMFEFYHKGDLKDTTDL